MTRGKRRKQKFLETPAPPKPPGNRRLVNIVEACSYSRLSRATLWRLIGAGKIKAYKVTPRRTMIDLDSVDKFLNNAPEFKAQAC